MLAGFEWVIEAKGYRKWAFPLVVIGMNSIAAYLIAHFLPDFLTSSFHTHFGAGRIQDCRTGASATARGFRPIADLLAGFVLDVPSQTVPAGMNGRELYRAASAFEMCRRRVFNSAPRLAGPSFPK